MSNNNIANTAYELSSMLEKTIYQYRQKLEHEYNNQEKNIEDMLNIMVKISKILSTLSKLKPEENQEIDFDKLNQEDKKIIDHYIEKYSPR
jgi:hypothetical protein